LDSVKRSNDANPKLLHFSTTQKVQLNSLKEVRPYLELEPSLKEKLGRGFQQARRAGGESQNMDLTRKHLHNNIPYLNAGLIAQKKCRYPEMFSSDLVSHSTVCFLLPFPATTLGTHTPKKALLSTRCSPHTTTTVSCYMLAFPLRIRFLQRPTMID
jgi:hypothetical protein